MIGYGGDGTYSQSGGSTSVKLAAVQSTSLSQSDSGLLIGVKTGSKGEYLLSAGSVSADPQQIGVGGTGTVVQTGGTNSTGSIQLATLPGSYGSYVSAADNLPSTRAATATRPMRPSASVGAGMVSSISAMTARPAPFMKLAGMAHRSSFAEPRRPMVQSTAMGRSTSAALWSTMGRSLPTVTGRTARSIFPVFPPSQLRSRTRAGAGPTAGSPAGTEGLTLPAIPVQAGTNTYTWGEDPGDPMIDLVNSVRFTVENAKHDGSVDIALALDPSLRHSHTSAGAPLHRRLVVRWVRPRRFQRRGPASTIR